MTEMTSGTALRQLQQAQAGLKKARQLLETDAGQGIGQSVRSSKAGWESLAQANRLMAAIPLEAADEAVLTRQLAVQRYATALLVRLRRLSGTNRGRSTATTTTVRRRGHRGLTGMARPKSPRAAVGAASRIRARPEPDAGRVVADDGHPLAGRPHRSSIARWSTGRSAPPRRTTATSCAWSTATACTSAMPSGMDGRRSALRFLSRQQRAAGAGVLGPPHRRGRRLADLGPRPRQGDKRLPRHSRRGGRTLRPDRRPLRRRPLGRGLQPGNVPADRADPRPARRSAGYGALPRGRRRAGARCRRTFRAGRWPARSSRPA